MTKIKFTNLYKLVPEKKKTISKIVSLIKNSKFVGGDEVKKFEENFSKYIESKYCITVANGTDALEIGIKSLNLKKGSEVILPVNTWISTAEAIITNNLKVVFCDVDKNTWNMSLQNVKEKITKNTKAVLMVHTYGLTAEAKKISKLCKDNNIPIIVFNIFEPGNINKAVAGAAIGSRISNSG